MEPGNVLNGRYLVVRLLGDGGMGEVWLASDEKLSRQVAIKRIKPELSKDPAFSKRFAKESQIAASLHDPRIITLFDSFEVDDVTCLVMQYIEGESLAAALKAGHLDFAAKADVMRGVLEGIVYLHTKARLAHSDLKPANIMLDTEGRAYIADFGIARSLDRSGNTPTVQALIGTSDYMAPELHQNATPTDASDMWAFGALAMFTFTGRVPRQGIPAKDFAGPLTALIQAALHDEPAERPSATALLTAWDVSLSGAILAAANAPTQPQTRPLAAVPTKPPRWRTGLLILGGAILAVLAVLGLEAASGVFAPKSPDAQGPTTPGPTVTVTQSVMVTPTPPSPPTGTPAVSAASASPDTQTPPQNKGPSTYNLTDVVMTSSNGFRGPKQLTIKTTQFPNSLQGTQFNNVPDEATYGLGGACTEFKVSVGLDAQSPQVGGAIVFQVYLDDVVRATATRGPYDEPQVLTLDVTGVARMKIVDTRPTYKDAFTVWGSPVLTCNRNPSPK